MRPLRVRLRLVALVIAVALGAASAGDAYAEDLADKATARDLFYQAGEEMKQGRYERAAELFAKSDRLYATPTALLGEARALVQLERLVAAYDRYKTIESRGLGSDASGPFREAFDRARSESAALSREIPTIVLSVRKGVPAVVTVDGTDVPRAALGSKRPVDPGRHVVRATAEGYQPFEATVDIARGESKALEIRFDTRAERTTAPTGATEPPSNDGTAQRAAGWAIFGAGAAGLVVWSATGIVYLLDESTVQGECDAQHLCSPEGLDAAERARDVGVVNTVALFAGLAAAAGGLTVALTAPDGTRTSVHATVSPAGSRVGFMVTF